MKATISKEGLLTIIPESEMEAYALRRWLEENLETTHSLDKILFEGFKVEDKDKES